MFHLPAEYGATYDHLLEEMGSSPKVLQSSLPLFWPMCGWQYQEGGWLVIGHSSNRWAVNGNKQKLIQAEYRLQRVEEARKLSEPEDKCPMIWLTDLNRYPWTGSNFWCVLNQIRLRETSFIKLQNAEGWASMFCYSNLFKFENTAINNQPHIMRNYASLLEQEIDAFRPSRIVVLANKKRFNPFAKQLGLDIEPHEGIVQGVAMKDGRRWVVTRHPMKLPKGGKKEESNKAFADEVMKAFVLLG